MGASAATVENAYMRGRLEETDKSQDRMMQMMHFQQQSQFMNGFANRMLGTTSFSMQRFGC